jgi:hypothetical protein
MKVLQPTFSPPQFVRKIHGSFKDFLESLERRGTVIIIAGKKRSGKTATGFRILENLACTTQRKNYTVGFPIEVASFITDAEALEVVENGSNVLIDEAGLIYNARISMSKEHRPAIAYAKLSGQKGTTLIFISQSTASIDVDLIRHSDIFLLKETGLLQSEFERPRIRRICEEARFYFRQEGDKIEKKKLTYVYSDDFRGLVKFELPSFWNDSISTAFK